MIIVKLQGGLGNQMFQYALGRQLAQKNQTKLKLDLSDYQNNQFRQYLLGYFNVKENFASEEDLLKFKKSNFRKIIEKIKPLHFKKIIKQRSYQFDSTILTLPNNIYLDGYWQSEKYFKEIEPIIRQEFTLKEKFASFEQALFKKISITNSISLHLRRGDYITSQKINNIYSQLPLDYYYQAIKRINITQPNFFVFSDDINWAKENLKLPSPVFFIDHGNRACYQDLILMSQCKYNIIANSSFSWWAAWLNNYPKKIVIAPKKWFKDTTINIQNIIPVNWQTL